MGYRVSPCCNTDGIPMYLLNDFIKETGCNILVELGTAGGLSAKEAAKHFSQVITVELNEDRPNYDLSIPNIEWVNGNSIDVLPKIVSGFVNYKTDKKVEGHRYVTFFVDSHFDGDKPKDSPYKDCYLLEELEIISWYSQDAIVIIDDARLFLGNPPQPNNATEWPTIQEVFDFFNRKFPYHFTTLVDDYIISMPDRIKWIYDRLWMKTYDTRYPNDKERIRNAVKLSFDSFKKYLEP